jgi:hypothetical protein
MPYKSEFDRTLYNKEWVWDQYVSQRKSAVQIAKEVGLGGPGVVAKALKRFGISQRTLSEAHDRKGHNVKYGDTIHSREWLETQYVKMNLNASDISRGVGCSVPTVLSALKKFGIEVKGIAEAKKDRPVRNNEGKVPARSKSGLLNTARRVLPEGPCTLCGNQCRVSPHHIDRDRTNFSAGNLENLCELHHLRHHRLEDAILASKAGVALHQGSFSGEEYQTYLTQIGWSPRKLHRVVRKRLRRQEIHRIKLEIKNMEKQLVCMEAD